MQVSNSTGQSTDYRVGTNGGAPVQADTDTLDGASTTSLDTSATSSGQLRPGASEIVDSSSWDVEFWIGGALVASARFADDPGTVTLVKNADGTYSIRTLTAAAA